MWALVTELLFSFVLLAFLVISCQNVLHIASGSVRSVLTYIHVQLDHELGEVEGVADEEENVTTRVVRRRVILKVQREGCAEKVEKAFTGRKTLMKGKSRRKRLFGERLKDAGVIQDMFVVIRVNDLTEFTAVEESGRDVTGLTKDTVCMRKYWLEVVYVSENYKNNDFYQ